MEGRRQRIKAVVNLQPKRKVDATKNHSQSKSISASISSSQSPTKAATNVSLSSSSSSSSPTKASNVGLSSSSSTSTAQANVVLPSTKLQVSSNLKHETNENISSQPQNNLDHIDITLITKNIIEGDHTDATKLENVEFKRPPDVKNISSETLNSSTTFIPSIPSEIQLEQQQLQQQNVIHPNSNSSSSSSSGSSSSSSQALKHRQRIKATPFFGVTRRSSIQGNSVQDIEEEHHRSRQRHLSEQGGHQASSVGSSSSIDKSQITETCPLDSNVTETGNNNAANTFGTSASGANANRNQITPSRYRKISSSEDTFQKSFQSFTAASKRSSNKYNSSKPVEKSAMKMLDFIYYNPSTNPMNSESDKTEQIQTESIVKEASGDKPTEEENQLQPNTTATEVTASASAPAVPVPQLKLGPNGEVILDEQSLVIETTAEKEGRKNLLKSEILYLDDNTGNNGFYKRHKRTREWPSEETIKFYRCLHTVGTDFSLMLTLFPNRTRRDLKLKFKKEEKINLGLVNKALLYPKTFNVDELRKELEVDELDNVTKMKKTKEVKTKNAIKRARKTYKTRTKTNEQSSVSRTLTGGEVVYETDRLLNNNGDNVSDPIAATTTTKLKEKIKNQKIKGKNVNVKEQEEEENSERETECNNVSGGDLDEQYFFDMLLKEEQDNNAHSSNTINQKKLMFKKASDIFLDDIDEILVRLSHGSLVLVSSEDSNKPGKTINEIYIMCKRTGQLSDRPLDLPEDVINCIISSEAYI